ncbi:MAG: SLBB domain-containing protein, partial [Candidatus Omnitrophica bacterium]|nr:SLBB domain-containing protein [Candidatus Omnitrophota bacterium]
MYKKIININALLALIFLSTTIFPSQSFSYEKKAYKPDSSKKENWVDESRGYEPVVYKKVRCPQCGMELFYIPGKESPHSHWVDYEVDEERPSSASSATEDSAKTKKAKKGKSENKPEKGLLSLFSKDNLKEEKTAEMPSDRDMTFSELRMAQSKRYELRQQITCPYDGYRFFPEGDIIEERKLLRRMITGEYSVIESSFTKAIPFGVSKELRQFGYDLFESKKALGGQEESPLSEGSAGAAGALTALGMLKAAFTPASSQPSFSTQTSTGQSAVVPIGPNYIIGPGDTLVINIWGSVQETFPVEVDREGKIMLPKAGPLYLWGIKFSEAEEKIKARLNQFYTNFNVDVSMGKIRNIQVFVMGEIREPGSYDINSQSTIFQALYAAGGPTKLGSLRRIKLIHGDQNKEEIDLYPFLLEGDNLKYSKIQSGDTIFVPSIGDVVAIAGNVKRPAIYETRSEVPLSDLLAFAGGITPTGDLQRIQVERIRNNERRVMLDIELNRSELGEFSLNDITMRNGDLVIVSPIVRLKHDFASILGNVERPGDYALSGDMKVSDLIKRAKGFMPGTYLQRAELARVTRDRTREIVPVDLEGITLGTEEDILLNEWDILLIYSEAEVQPVPFVEIEGAVNKPGRYELTPGMKITDLIF